MLSFNQNTIQFLGSKTSRDIPTNSIIAARRIAINKETRQSTTLIRKPSISNTRRNTSRDKSTSEVNNSSSFMNTSQLDNRCSSSNAHYVQESGLHNYIVQAFDRERKNQVVSQSHQALPTREKSAMVRKENKSPIISRPGSCLEDIKPLQEVQNNKTKSQEEYRQREIKYLMRIAALEKDNQKLHEHIKRYKDSNGRKEQQEVSEQRLLELSNCREQLNAQVQELREQLSSQKAENAMLKKYVSTRRSESKTISTRANTITSVGSCSGNKKNIQLNEYVPSFMLALQMTDGK